MDCSPPGSSVHGSLQARILEWVAIPLSRGSSQPRDQTQVSHNAGRFFTIWATWDVLVEKNMPVFEAIPYSQSHQASELSASMKEKIPFPTLFSQSWGDWISGVIMLEREPGN